MLEGKQETKKKIQTMSSVEMCEMKAPFQLIDSVTEAGRKPATVAVEKTEEQEGTKVFPSSNIPEDVKMHASLPSSFFDKHKLETTMSSLEMCEMKAPFQLSDSVADAERKSATVAVGNTEEQERTMVFSSSNIPEDVKMHASLPSSFVNKQKLETPSKNMLSVGPNSVPEELKSALLQESSDMLPSNSESAFGDKGMSAPSNGSETSISKYRTVGSSYQSSYQSSQGNQGESDPNNTTIFVGGLDLNVSDNELRAVFGRFGELTHVKIPAGKRCGFVQFSSRACAEQALSMLNNTLLGVQNIRLSWGRSPSSKQALNCSTFKDIK